MIRIAGLYKSYGSKEVLKNINIEFSSGKIYGIIGENGAGKTTLFRCIAGLENYRGEIYSDLKPLKDHLGLLFSDPFFFPKITGREYVRLLCNARGKEVPDIDASNIFDLPLNQYVSTYSTGMKKKLALMAILVQGNECFILDEPFNGIDINGSIMLTEILLRLKQSNKIVILSSHIFSTLSDTCDEIHILRNGDFTEVVEREYFDRLESQMRQAAVIERIGKLELK
ncbi:MAG: ATP-binding cassette domain-containing protein [Bacteroidales bacterium]|nr:ATP-binding cassette domain-containing protein [Bacteroidales bacterium]